MGEMRLSGKASPVGKDEITGARSFVECDTTGQQHWFWHSYLRDIYERLSLNDSPESADLIFVVAGRMERKRYGLELFRAGFAPRLVLSVGRFEVSKMRGLDIEGVDRLIAMRDKLHPDERHFFVTLDSSGTRIENAKLQRCSTYGEALAFCDLLRREKAGSVIVVSTDVHLRRLSLTFNKLFHGTHLKFIYCRVPSRLSFLQRNIWWTVRENRKFVLKEMMKLIGYRVILGMPEWACRRLMRLKS